MKSSIVALTISAMLAIGCGATPGTEPHDMSHAGHEQAAAEEEAQAEEHATQETTDTSPKETKRCGGRGFCWTVEEGPSEKHAEMAEAHRKAAAEHRAAAAALADAEAKACEGLAPEDRDMSPFAHRDDIASVSPLVETAPAAKTKTEKTVGAIVKFKAIPGLTAEWLQRVVNCHIARAAAVGHEMPEMPYCPLVPKGVSATVKSAGDGFDVEIKSADAAGAEEVLRRAKSLTSE